MAWQLVLGREGAALQIALLLLVLLISAALGRELRRITRA
jgi:hypothetical protein